MSSILGLIFVYVKFICISENPNPSSDLPAVTNLAENGHATIQGKLHACAKINLRNHADTMKPSEALQLHRAAIVDAATRFRTTNPRVFGSVLTAQDTERSDLDLLVDPLPGTTLFDLGGLQVELEELLGMHVDLLTPGDLPAKFRHQVLSQAQPL